MIRSKLMIGLAFLSMSACSTPKIPDPRFELPNAPQELMAPAPQLKTIETTPVKPKK
jgi:hypothetical protein